jgi:hypothetical protein
MNTADRFPLDQKRPSPSAGLGVDIHGKPEQLCGPYSTGTRKRQESERIQAEAKLYTGIDVSKKGLEDAIEPTNRTGRVLRGTRRGCPK